MYAAIWRALPGPTWVKVVEAVLLVAAAVAVLFLWVFPWLAGYVEFYDVTVG